MELKKIATLIKRSRKIAIVGHVNPDGDCIGSVTALLQAIRKSGRECYMYLDAPVPRYIEYLMKPDYVTDVDRDYDLCIALDCADRSRVADGKGIFENEPKTASIDHHITNTHFADVNYVDSNASATGEIIYEFLTKYLKVKLDTHIASSIYSAISSDTGNFKFANTKARTHIIASKLMDYDVDIAEINRQIFDTHSLDQIALMGEFSSGLKTHHDGKVIVGKLTYEMVEKHNLTFEDTDYLVSIPRSVEGCEVGVFMKVKSDDEIKVSLRSNGDADVSKVASVFGGGGHVRASGATFNCSYDEAIEKVLNEIAKELKICIME